MNKNTCMKSIYWSLTEQYEASKGLWAAVIIQALQDAKAAILKTKTAFVEERIAREMEYFKSKEFETVCFLAGVIISPKIIEKKLRSVGSRGWKRVVRK